MGAHSLFIYGTLRDGDVLSAVLGHDCANLTICEGEAPFMQVLQVAHVDYPCLRQGKDDDVAEGALLSDLSDEDIRKLDQFEGENYKRMPLEVIADRKLVKTQAYFPLIELETAGFWSFEAWRLNGRDGFMARDFNLAGVRKPDNEAS